MAAWLASRTNTNRRYLWRNQQFNEENEQKHAESSIHTTIIYECSQNKAYELLRTNIAKNYEVKESRN